MTDAPDLEPAAFITERLDGTKRSVMLIEKYDPRKPEFWANEEARAQHRVIPLYAARSAPEAGKAVDETMTALSGFLVFLKDMRFTGSWDLATLNRAIEVGETIAEQQSTLASVAPSGAEPTQQTCPSCGGNGVNPEGIIRPFDGSLADCEICDGRGTVPFQLPPEIMGSFHEVLGEVADLDGLELAEHWMDRAERAEAEATSLRSKLEEHRRVLAEARERINRYADTAAEHDLVARIDALSGASQ